MEFYRSSTVKAVRKRHRCDGCPSHIEIGDPAWRWAGRYDGEFSTAIYHNECRKAEEAINDLHETYPGEWMSLCEIEDDDRQWLIDEHPIVAARYGFIANQEQPS